MLRFTKQVDYGLMAMQYIAARRGDAAVGIKRIADEFGIPSELLAKICQRLAKGGLRVAQSGPRGGYQLTRAPSAVTVGQEIRVLEGPLAIISCMADQGDCAGVALHAPESGAEAPGGDHRLAGHDDVGRTNGRQRAGGADGTA